MVYLRSVCVSGFTFSPLLGGRDGSSLGGCAHTSTTPAYAEAVALPDASQHCWLVGYHPPRAADGLCSPSGL